MSVKKTIQPKISKALIACGVSGISGFGAASAKADIVAANTPPGVPAANTTLNINDPNNPSFTPVGWDVDGDGNDDFKRIRLQTPGGSTNASFLGGTNGGELAIIFANSDLAKVASSNSVGSANDFSTTFLQIVRRFYSSSVVDVAGFGADGNWAMGDTANFGFKFTIGANTHYGWGKMSLNPGANYEIIEAYYETTPGLAIHVGTTSVPEPTSAALLVLGAAGLVTWRRKRKRAA